MFFRTLGVKTDRMITEFVKCKEVATQIKDKRGKAAPKNKLDKDLLRKHIMSYDPQISHYISQNAPNKRYLKLHLTITATWEDYKSTGTLRVSQ